MKDIQMNFFQMPNELWDLPLDVYERAIFTHIVRKTIGWGKTKDGISLSQFEKDLKISKPKVVSVLKELINMDLVEKEMHQNSNGGNGFNTYCVSKNIVNVVNEINKGVVNDINKGSKPHLQGVVNHVNTQKTTITKDTRQKNKKIQKKDSRFEIFTKELLLKFKELKISTLKDKVNKTDETKEAFKNLKVDNMHDVINKYANYVRDKKNYAKRLNAWLIAYNENSLYLLEDHKQNKHQAPKSVNDQIDEYYSKRPQQNLFIDAEEI